MLRKKSISGFTFAEMLVVIAVIGVLAAVSIPRIAGILPSAREQTAMRNLRYINAAIIAYNNAASEITPTTVPTSSGIGDETAVFVILKARAEDLRGSPFLPVNVVPTSSSATDSYRARWNGQMFEIITPGNSGTGVNLLNIMGYLILRPAHNVAFV